MSDLEMVIRVPWLLRSHWHHCHGILVASIARDIHVHHPRLSLGIPGSSILRPSGSQPGSAVNGCGDRAAEDLETAGPKVHSTPPRSYMTHPTSREAFHDPLPFPTVHALAAESCSHASTSRAEVQHPHHGYSYFKPIPAHAEMVRSPQQAHARL
jgi:hypothetical protein